MTGIEVYFLRTVLLTALNIWNPKQSDVWKNIAPQLCTTGNMEKLGQSRFNRI